MLTTKQVRAIIAQHRNDTHGVYTNKTTGHTGLNRRVKCYYRGDARLLMALQKAAGVENVKLTSGGSHYRAMPGIVVKCLLG